VSPWSTVPVDPRRAELIRRRAHVVLRGGLPRRASSIEVGLVAVFSVLLLVWATHAVLVWS
jgi:hypothetical protein